MFPDFARRRTVWSALGIFILMASTAAAQCVGLTSLGTAYNQDFNTLATSGTTNSNLPAGWLLTETGGGARDNEQYAADNGGSNTGDTYAYGTDTERAFGGLQSGTLIPVIGACFTNNTGAAIQRLSIAYRGEQWRIGTLNRSDRIDFQYSLNATSLATGSWTDVDALDFTGPVTTGSTGAKDGNSAAHLANLTSTINIVIPAGATLYIRWTDLNASGADDGLAVDDFSLTPQGNAFQLTPTSLTLDGIAGGSSVNANVQVGAATATAFSTTSDAAWLSATPGTTPGTSVITANPAALSAGTYSGTVTFTGEGIDPATLTVRFNVSAATLLTLSPTTLPAGVAGTAYPATVITANGGMGCVFSVSGGALPGGLNLTNATSNTVTVAGTPLVSGSFTATIQAVCANGSTTRQYTIIVDIGCGAPNRTLISAIQGSGNSAALPNNTVVEVEGIVVGDFQGAGQVRGFFLQDPTAESDGNPATSDGIFVFEGNTSLLDVNFGDRVRIKGSVLEFNSGSGATLTEITTITNIRACGTGTVTPVPVTLPLTSGNLENLEGMLVELPGTYTVSNTFELYQFGSALLSNGRLYTPTHFVAPGAPALAQQAANDLNQIILDDASTASFPFPTLFPFPGLSTTNTLRLGSIAAGIGANNAAAPFRGVIDHRFGRYRVYPVETLQFLNPSNPRPLTPPVNPGRYRVASFNIGNYFTTLDLGPNVCGPTGTVSCRGANTGTEFKRQHDKLVAALRTLDAHIVSMNELENNTQVSINILLNGGTINGVTVEGLNHTTPGKWAFVGTGATVGTDSIRNAIIYQTAVVTPVGTLQVLDSTVDPRAVSSRQRPSIAQKFEPATGTKKELQRFWVVSNHWRAKGSSCATASQPDQFPDPLVNDGQAQCNLTRVSIANAVIDWIASPGFDPGVPAADRKVIVVGDLNAYFREDPIRALTDPTFSVSGGGKTFGPNPNAVLRHVIAGLADETTAYGYTFQGQSGFLDHVLVTPALDRLVTAFAEWHINADEPIALDYNTEDKNAAALAALYAMDPFRTSDHDPAIAWFNPLCGDLDDDGDVDSADRALMLGAVGKAGNTLNRRFDFDGSGGEQRLGNITFNDFSLWSRCEAAFRR